MPDVRELQTFGPMMLGLRVIRSPRCRTRRAAGGDAAGNDILVGDARYGAFHRFIEPDELRFSSIQIADLRLTQLFYPTPMLLRQLNYYRSHRQTPGTMTLSRARDAVMH